MGFDTSEFKATEFNVVDLIHPDDTITQAKSPKVAYREQLNVVFQVILLIKV